uniref:BZIP domain-containing protein n=1 Tax=Strigamia maritima TaxID=126957 RepID=T1J7U6_STRMM
MPYIRTVNMEQRWQDLANILSLPISTESEIHNSLHNSIAMVHAPTPHNYQSTNPAYGGIDNRGAILLHNTPMPPPTMSDINSNIPYHNSDLAEISPVAAAVATSLSTLTNGTDVMGDSSAHTATYTGEGSTLLYTHNTTEMNPTSDGFLSSILNDEDLQLMDMSMNEGVYNPAERYIQSNQPMHGMYPMRIENEDAMDTSSDSAVSSMGSTGRGVPAAPISEGVQHPYCRNNNEWVENGSNSSHHHEEHERYYSAMDYAHHSSSLTNKYRPYDYAYPSRHHHLNPGVNSSLEHRHIPPVAQKKYQLFGKRFPADHAIGGGLYQANRNPSLIQHVDYTYERNHQERSARVPFEMMEGATVLEHPDHKFNCNMDFARQNNSVQIGHVQHNHPYQLPSESIMSPQRTNVRDKLKKKSHSSSSSEESNTSRDEKRARALKIPLNTEEIINLPMDEFNERISKFDLTEAQLALIRDIRRRGKNKVAAQNCRKRKLDQILTLAEVVHDLQENKDEVLRQRENLLAQRQRLQDKYNVLYRHVFQSIRDSDGNSFPSCDYSLQHSTNGSMILVPNNTVTDISSGTKPKRKDDNRKC